MAKDLGLSVVAGIASAVVFVSTLTGGMLGVLLAYLLPLPLALVGLSFGLRRMWIGAGAALAVVVTVAPSTAPVFAAVAVLPGLILVRQGLQVRQTANGTVEWYSPGLLAAWLAVLAVALMVLGTSLVPTDGAGLEETIRTGIAHVVDEVLPGVATELKGSMLGLWSALFPAMLGSGWLIMTTLNGVVAQWTVSRAGHALRPTPDYTRLELPSWLLAVLVVAALIGLAAGGDIGYVGRNASVVLLWPYVFAGLATVHRVVRGRPNAGLLLTLFYVVFFAMFGWALVAVAGLGLVRHWTRLRRRDAGSGQEEK